MSRRHIIALVLGFAWATAVCYSLVELLRIICGGAA